MAPAETVHEPADVVPMVAYAEVLLYDLRDPLRRPQLRAVSIGDRSLQQDFQSGNNNIERSKCQSHPD